MLVSRCCHLISDMVNPLKSIVGMVPIRLDLQNSPLRSKTLREYFKRHKCMNHSIWYLKVSQPHNTPRVPDDKVENIVEVHSVNLITQWNTSITKKSILWTSSLLPLKSLKIIFSATSFSSAISLRTMWLKGQQCHFIYWANETGWLDLMRGRKEEQAETSRRSLGSLSAQLLFWNCCL